MGQPRRYAGPLIFMNKTIVPAPHNVGSYIRRAVEVSARVRGCSS
jgi:hypothetical protein